MKKIRSNFHGVIKGRLRKKKIHGLLSNGIWETEPLKLKTMALEFFKEKYKKSSMTRPFFRRERLRKLSADKHKDLELPFLKEEIREVVWR